MATVLVIGVIQLGVQATAARRVAADPAHLGEIERTVVTVTLWFALASERSVLLASPLLMDLLRLDGIGPGDPGRGHRRAADHHRRPGRHAPG